MAKQGQVAVHEAPHDMQDVSGTCAKARRRHLLWVLCQPVRHRRQRGEHVARIGVVETGEEGAQVAGAAGEIRVGEGELAVAAVVHGGGATTAANPPCVDTARHKR